MICNKCGEVADPKTGSVLVLSGDTEYTARTWMDGKCLQYERGEDYTTLLISCGTCSSRAKNIHRSEDMSHRIRITLAYGNTDTLITETQFGSLKNAKDFIAQYVQEHAGILHPNFSYEICNKLGEIVIRDTVDNGNPNRKSWLRQNHPDAKSIRIFNGDTTYFYRDYQPEDSRSRSWEDFKRRCVRLGGYDQYGSVWTPVTLTLTNLDNEIVDSLTIDAKTEEELEDLRKACTVRLETYRESLEGGRDVFWFSQTYVAEIEYAQQQFDRHVEVASENSATTKIRLLNKYSGDVLREWVRS